MSTALLSPDGQYRYILRRKIPSPLRWIREILFIMLNPSTATDIVDDPTIRRCMGFATLWGFTDLTVVNLFALRATDPKELRSHADPVGPDNNGHLRDEIHRHRQLQNVIIAAWGADPMAISRVQDIRDLLVGVHCLGITKAGAPRHPLYLKKTATPVPWELAA